MGFAYGNSSLERGAEVRLGVVCVDRCFRTTPASPKADLVRARQISIAPGTDILQFACHLTQQSPQLATMRDFHIATIAQSITTSPTVARHRIARENSRRLGNKRSMC